MRYEGGVRRVSHEEFLERVCTHLLLNTSRNWAAENIAMSAIFRASEAFARAKSSGSNSATTVVGESETVSDVLSSSFGTGVATRVAGLD
jgi:hypothetical protein